MHYLNQDKDNIIALVKTLRPIKYIYSKQNKDFNKYFRGSNLEDLMKQINIQHKFNEFLKPGESLDEYNSKNFIMDVNFRSTFNYIDELSKLKNLPLTILKKNKKQNLSNHYKEKKKQNKNKNKRKINDKKNIMLIKLKNKADENATLDPGRYHPNYDFIKKRIPCAYLGKPKPKEDFYTQSLEENEEKKEENIIQKKIKSESKDINSDNENSIEKNKHNKKLNSIGKATFYSSSNKTIFGKTYQIQPKKINFKNMKFERTLYKKDDNKNAKLISRQRGSFPSSILKEQNTASSWNNTVEGDNSKKLSQQMKSKDKNKSLYNNSNMNFYNTQRASYILKKNKKYLFKNSSTENLRCPIIFDKMPGRDKPVNIFNTKEIVRTIYNPDYNITRAHIPSTIFKSERKHQDIKKYITGKIIRSYFYNPEEYFVFEYKENKENEMAGKYRTLVLNS